MSPTILFILIPAMVIAAFTINFYFSKKAKIKRKLKNAEFKKLSEFRSGEIAKITGKVEFAENPIKAPLSDRECAWYYVHIEERTSGKNSSWKTLIEEEASCNFVIRDGKECAFINDKRIQSYIVQDKEYSSGFLKDTTKVLEKYLKAHGHESEGFFGFNKTLRYKEGILAKGEEIAVYGKGEWKNAKQVNLPEIYNRVLVITSTGSEAIYLSDDPDTLNKKI